MFIDPKTCWNIKKNYYSNDKQVERVEGRDQYRGTHRVSILYVVDDRLDNVVRRPSLETQGQIVGREADKTTGSPSMRCVLHIYSNSLPAQPNIKHLSCNKQPLLGYVNTSRMRPSLLCLTINLYGNKVYKHNTKKVTSTEITISTQARITIV